MEQANCAGDVFKPFMNHEVGKKIWAHLQERNLEFMRTNLDSRLVDLSKQLMLSLAEDPSPDGRALSASAFLQYCNVML